jgi:hypothetical protein
MTVIFQSPGVPITPALQRLDDIAKACNQEIKEKEDKRVSQKKKKSTCQELGIAKHKCCDEKIADDNEEKKKNGETPTYEGEKCYNRPRFNKKTGKFSAPVDTTELGLDRASVMKAAVASCAKGSSKKTISQAIGRALGNKIFPDAALLGPRGEKTFVDFKFACPESHRSKKAATKARYRSPSQSNDQAAAHTALGQATGGGETVTILF